MDFISLALWTLCVVLIFTILSIVHHQYNIRQKFKNFPQIGGYPFIGTIFEHINMSKYERLKWIVSFMYKCKEGIYVQWLGARPFIDVFKPEYLQHIFPSTVNIEKADTYNFLKPWLGNGLVTATGHAGGSK
ncbi:PREDICTED: cytochrome P450 4c21-like [Vollenhovia emeryi]|uniref:cytochrome P450 4c21-like n=1 Tax=Vollenhovia emeryi TaxID=411798 RepID=UPI0005F3C179|nr:PREDICTED: cytochrome P450 4c21-like [Vollenhovia emeryi]